MLDYDEKRDYIRMDVDCEITYKMADSDTINTGRCTSLSGAGVSFITESAYAFGLAMEIKLLPQNSVIPPMTAFVQVVRSNPREDGTFEVAATIKSLK